MRLNHLDLHVPDVATTTNFLVTCLGLRLVEMRGANGLAILTDDNGLELVISKSIARYGGIDQVETGRISYHIGFIVDERSEVDAVYARIAADHGADLWHEPREIRGGWLFYCIIPGNILVEVGARPLHA
jgi:hypothetical protein